MYKTVDTAFWDQKKIQKNINIITKNKLQINQRGKTNPTFITKIYKLPVHWLGSNTSIYIVVTGPVWTAEADRRWFSMWCATITNLRLIYMW